MSRPRSSQSQGHPCGASRWSCCPALTISDWSRKKPRIEHDDEVIPRPAPLHQRFVAGLVDVASFSGHRRFCSHVCGTGRREYRSHSMTMVCMMAAGGIFWLVFQYIFLIYRRATPGMNMARLELCTFEGKATTMFDRQTPCRGQRAFRIFHGAGLRLGAGG